MIYMSHNVFLRKELLFGVVTIVSALKFLVALIFVIAIHSLTH